MAGTRCQRVRQERTRSLGLSLLAWTRGGRGGSSIPVPPPVWAPCETFTPRAQQRVTQASSALGLSTRSVLLSVLQLAQLTCETALLLARSLRRTGRSHAGPWGSTLEETSQPAFHYGLRETQRGAPRPRSSHSRRPARLGTQV